MERNRTPLFALGGEFAQPETEAEYLGARLPETLRHARLTFILAVVANLLFVVSDWRFLGQPHFVPAIVSRAVIIACSLAGLVLAQRCRDVRSLVRLCLVWCVPVLPACAVLVSPQTEAALAIIFLLPVILYLVMPLPFRWAVATGVLCSAACLGSYLANANAVTGSRLAIVLALFTANAVLALVLVHLNRLQRLAWAAGRAEQEANRELSEHRGILQALLRAVPAPLVILAHGSGRLIQANDAAWTYFGRTALASPEDFARCFPPGVLDRLVAAAQADEADAGQECALTLPDGRRRDALLATGAAPLRGDKAVLLVVVDITSRKEMEQRLERLANTDPLTGLANRASFFARAAEELLRTRRYRRPLAVLMIDIDHFKRINDTRGHEAGDRALREFADLCREIVREPDVVGRIGGEEFALLLPETPCDNAVALADRLRAAVERLHATDPAGPLTVSIGVSEVRTGEASVEPALARADAALYTAKGSGRNRVELHC